MHNHIIVLNFCLEIIPALYKQIPFVADYLKSSSMLDLEWEQVYH